jgi:AraC-like DNA-binding protein
MSALAPDILAALRQAHDLIDRDYSEPLDLEVLAAEAGYSKFHFARSFADAYGETPRAYLSRRRIERAKDLLRSANLSITEICFLVGFESLGSFSALFRRLVGQSPSGYRAANVDLGTRPPIPGCLVLMWTRPTPRSMERLPQARRSAPSPR